MQLTTLVVEMLVKERSAGAPRQRFRNVFLKNWERTFPVALTTCVETTIKITLHIHLHLVISPLRAFRPVDLDLPTSVILEEYG